MYNLNGRTCALISTVLCFELLYFIGMQDNRIELNGVKVHPFTSHDELLAYVSQKKGILVAINAEKILHAKGRLLTFQLCQLLQVWPQAKSVSLCEHRHPHL